MCAQHIICMGYSPHLTYRTSRRAVFQLSRRYAPSFLARAHGHNRSSRVRAPATWSGGGEARMWSIGTRRYVKLNRGFDVCSSRSEVLCVCGAFENERNSYLLHICTPFTFRNTDRSLDVIIWNTAQTVMYYCWYKIISRKGLTLRLLHFNLYFYTLLHNNICKIEK